MSRKEYYSQRKGLSKINGYEFIDVLILFCNIYNDLKEGQYFGREDMYGHHHGGKFGSNPGSKILKTLKKKNLYPIVFNSHSYSEEDLFDIIEFLFDYCSAPLKDMFGNLQYSLISNEISYDKEVGQIFFRDEINEILRDYKDGFELTKEGYIETLNKEGLEQVLDQEIVSLDNETDSKVKESIRIFRRSGTILEKQSSLKQLADVLEHFRNDYKSNPINGKDENAIFDIANNFAVRHYNLKQKDKYPQDLYYSWIFHIFLSTYHLWARLIKANSVILK